MSERPVVSPARITREVTIWAVATGFILMLFFASPSWGKPAGFVALATVAPLALIWIAARRPRSPGGRFAVGFSLGVAIAIVLTAAPLFTLLLFAAIMGDFSLVLLGALLLLVQLRYVRFVLANHLHLDRLVVAGIVTMAATGFAVYGLFW